MAENPNQIQEESTAQIRQSNQVHLHPILGLALTLLISACTTPVAAENPMSLSPVPSRTSVHLCEPDAAAKVTAYLEENDYNFEGSTVLMPDLGFMKLPETNLPEDPVAFVEQYLKDVLGVTTEPGMIRIESTVFGALPDEEKLTIESITFQQDPSAGEPDIQRLLVNLPEFMADVTAVYAQEC